MSSGVRDGRWFRLRDRVLEEDGGVCQCCGGGRKISVHHIIPVSEGGGLLDHGNLVSICESCGKRVHDIHLRYGGQQFVLSGAAVVKVFNVAILREMRITGTKTSVRESFRGNFLRRRKIPDGRRPLSKRLINMARMIQDAEIDITRLPWVFDFGPFEVCIRTKEDPHEGAGIGTGPAADDDGDHRVLQPGQVHLSAGEAGQEVR